VTNMSGKPGEETDEEVEKADDTELDISNSDVCTKFAGSVFNIVTGRFQRSFDVKFFLLIQGTAKLEKSRTWCCRDLCSK